MLTHEWQFHNNFLWPSQVRKQRKMKKCTSKRAYWTFLEPSLCDGSVDGRYCRVDRHLLIQMANEKRNRKFIFRVETYFASTCGHTLACCFHHHHPRHHRQHSLEIETKVHLKVRNHGEGPYLGLSPGSKCLLELSYLRHYAKQALIYTWVDTMRNNLPLPYDLCIRDWEIFVKLHLTLFQALIHYSHWHWVRIVELSTNLRILYFIMLKKNSIWYAHDGNDQGKIDINVQHTSIV